MSKRGHHEGSIDARGEHSWRLRYRVNGKRHTVTVHGTKSEAREQLRKLLSAADVGQHVAPDKITLAKWIDHWIKAGAPGRRRKQVGRRTIERYAELMRVHVVPALGARVLQQVQAAEIDCLYVALETKIAARTAHHVHVVLSACLSAAVRSGMLAISPMARVMKVPAPGEADHGMALDEAELIALVQGFKGTPLYPIVALASFTGARRNEILALRWTDLSFENKTLTIARAVEEPKEGGRRTKAPKTARGKRTIAIDDGLVGMLRKEREKYLRLVAGVPDKLEIDLSLVRLPPDAVMFPGGDGTDLTKLRDAHAVTRGFVNRARRLGFPGLRFHDLRGSHETALLNRGVGVHVVAARCGHDPAVLLRSYAKLLEQADANAADVISRMSKNAFA